MWQQWLLFLLGGIIGLLAGMGVVSLCSMAGYGTQCENIRELRIALAVLTSAVEDDVRTKTRRVELAVTRAMEALNQ